MTRPAVDAVEIIPVVPCSRAARIAALSDAPYAGGEPLEAPKIGRAACAEGAQSGLRFVAGAGAGEGLANRSLSAGVRGAHRLQSRGPRSKKGQANE